MAERKIKHRYARVSRRMRSDARVMRLTWPEPCGLSLFEWAITCRQGGSLPGVICMGLAAIAEANRWSSEQLAEPLAELLREGLIEIDQNACLVWLPNALKHDAPANGNTVSSWRHTWDEVPECTLKTRIYRSLRQHMIERQSADDAGASNGKKPKKTDWLAVFESACGTLEENRFGTVGDTIEPTVSDTVTETVPSRARARISGSGTLAGAKSSVCIAREPSSDEERIEALAADLDPEVQPHALPVYRAIANHPKLSVLDAYDLAKTLLGNWVLKGQGDNPKAHTGPVALASIKAAGDHMTGDELAHKRRQLVCLYFDKGPERAAATKRRSRAGYASQAPRMAPGTYQQKNTPPGEEKAWRKGQRP